MSQEPSFPADAFDKKPSPAPAPTAAPVAAPPPQDDETDSTAAGGDASGSQAAAAVAALKSMSWQQTAGVAVGVGSAALAAALLYRSRRK